MELISENGRLNFSKDEADAANQLVYYVRRGFYYDSNLDAANKYIKELSPCLEILFSDDSPWSGPWTCRSEKWECHPRVEEIPEWDLRLRVEPLIEAHRISDLIPNRYGQGPGPRFPTFYLGKISRENIFIGSFTYEMYEFSFIDDLVFRLGRIMTPVVHGLVECDHNYMRFGVIIDLQKIKQLYEFVDDFFPDLSRARAPNSKISVTELRDLFNASRREYSLFVRKLAKKEYEKLMTEYIEGSKTELQELIEKYFKNNKKTRKRK